MGILDTVSQMAGQFSDGGEKAQVAGGLMEEVQSQPNGVGAIMQSFQQNGMGGLVQQWMQGQTTPATPEQVQQGLNGTGMIERISKRSKVASSIVQTGLSIAIPLLVNHYASKGHVDAQGQPTGTQPETSSVLQTILSHLR